MERYEEWDVSIPPLPSRSRLYRLKPIGIGTPYVESLTSYIARLAEEHRVTPKDLIMREIIPSHSQAGPILNYYYRMNRFWIENASALNGVSPIARQWVELLQSLTTSDNLIFLTMLPFNEVVAVNRLLRRSKAWCAQCYEEWRLAHQAVYEPLLWSLSGIDCCLYHRRPLVTLCPYCQKTKPFLTQTTRPGYCPHCTQWLGGAQRPLHVGDTSDDTEVSAYQYWVVEVSGHLLAAAPLLAAPPSRKQIAMRLSALVDDYAGGNVSKLARFLGVKTESLWTYLHQGKIPYFGSLLKMCFALSMAPLEFLSTTTPLPRSGPYFTAVSIPTISRGKRRPLTEDDILRMRQVLEALLATDNQADSPLYIKDIAQRMGFDEETVRKHCPDLCRAIARRNKNHWTEESQSVSMRQALEKALANPEPVPLVDVARQLHCDTTSMRRYFPDLCRAIVTKYRERFDYAFVEQRLQEVLASTSETPAVYELAREMGYKRHIVRDKFPELCKQVSARRYAERRRRREERMAGIRREIRRATSLLHQQDIYPSARRVFSMLNDPHVLRTKEGHEAWRLALEELGYPTDELKRYD